MEEGMKMKRLLMALVVLGLAVALTAPVFCGEQEDYGRDDECGYAWGSGHMMGPGYGWGSGHMMHRGPSGWGMGGRGWRWDQSPRGWRSMKPEQRENWEKMRNSYLIKTLELRQQLTAKEIELQTLWVQPNMDKARVEKLSNEVADLRAKLFKKRDEFLLQCRREFGDQDWTCPGAGWQGGRWTP